MQARTEDGTDTEAKETEKGKGRDFKGRVGCVGRRDTRQVNAQREKGKEEKVSGEERERKEKETGHFMESVICADSGDIRPSIFQKAKEKERAG